MMQMDSNIICKVCSHLIVMWIDLDCLSRSKCSYDPIRRTTTDPEDHFEVTIEFQVHVTIWKPCSNGLVNHSLLCQFKISLLKTDGKSPLFIACKQCGDEGRHVHETACTKHEQAHKEYAVYRLWIIVAQHSEEALHGRKKT